MGIFLVLLQTSLLEANKIVALLKIYVQLLHILQQYVKYMCFSSTLVTSCL